MGVWVNLFILFWHCKIVEIIAAGRRSPAQLGVLAAQSMEKNFHVTGTKFHSRLGKATTLQPLKYSYWF